MRFAFETKCYSFSVIAGQCSGACQQVFMLSSNPFPCLTNNIWKIGSTYQHFEKLQNEKEIYFKQHGRRFLEIAKEKSKLSRQTHQSENRADASINEIIEFFKEKEMHPFLTALIREISSAMNIDAPEIKHSSQRGTKSHLKKHSPT